MLTDLKREVIRILEAAGIEGKLDLVMPPKKEMGDMSLPCFVLARDGKNSPADIAFALTNKLTPLTREKKKKLDLELIDRVEAAGPYVNFYFNPKFLARFILDGINKASADYGKNNIGGKRKALVEFAQPNTHKEFHLGHLRGTVTGESISRILENAGYSVARVNYQGDVGMHIAKCLWSILKVKDLKKEIKKLDTLEKKIKFLGEAYVAGAAAFEEDEESEAQIIEVNEKIYAGDKSVKKLYQETRAWSLEYFEQIYKRLGTHFDRYYFESEMSKRGIEIVKAYLKKGVFVESEGAVIFPGAKFGLHDRVFLNSLGLPTYEAKDLALAETQFSEFNPDKVIHVVAREQKEYFKVLFKALEQTLSESKGRQCHLSYGWLDLKEGKMSSRAGKVVSATWLLDQIKNKINNIMSDFDARDKDMVAEKVALAAVKYAFLKTGIKNDISFELEESVSLSGDSGPYLLYIVARIKSILKKVGKDTKQEYDLPEEIFPEEKALLLKIAEFPEVALEAAENLDPAKIAQYLFELAQIFNHFYHERQIIQAGEEAKYFRIELIKKVEQVMERGLGLLGLETVERM